MQKKKKLTTQRMTVFVIASLTLLIFAIYSNSFDCSWQFDDAPNISENPRLHLTKLSWSGIESALHSDRNNPDVLYRPLPCLSFALNYYFGGLNVYGYHFVNISIHLLTSIFLFLFLLETFKLPLLRTRYSSSAFAIALLSTTLWAINPVQTQAVTYIVQRMASLAGMFYILTMYLYVKGRTAQSTRKAVPYFAACLLSFAMALGSKENSAMVPMSIIFYEILLVQGDAKIFSKWNLRWFLTTLGAAFLITLLYLYFKNGDILSFLNGYKGRPFTLSQRLLTEPRIVVFYISLLLYPMPNRLNIAHVVEPSTGLFHPLSTFLAIALIAGLVASAIYMARKRPLIAFCIFFFFLNHIIESTIIPLELVFEHRNYIPSMLFFLPFSISILRLLKFYENRSFMRVSVSAFVVLLLVGLGHATYMRNFAWKNEMTLWLDAAEKAPNQARAHHNLGLYYQDHGRIKEAISEYEKALAIPISNRKDEKSVTYYNLGKIYAKKKDFEKAHFFYERSIELNPDYSPLYNDMAAMYDMEGKGSLAFNYLVKAVKLQPNSIMANYNLGLAYLRKRDPDKAIYHLKKLLNRHDKLIMDRVPLYIGVAFKQKGKLGSAEIYLKRALEVNPENIAIYLHLAEIYCLKGEQDRAKLQISKAISFIRDQNTFTRIIEHLTESGESRNIEPKAKIVVPLMAQLYAEKAKKFIAWSECLGDSLQDRKGIRKTERMKN